MDEIGDLREGNKNNYRNKDKRSEKINQIMSESENISNKFKNKIEADKFKKHLDKKEKISV